MEKTEILITSYARTPQGNFLGALKDLSATDLGAHIIAAALDRASIPKDKVDEVIMGCVLPAGLGQAPARQAALKAGLSEHTSCTTINKVCGSGMKAVMLAHDILQAKHANIIVAGGMESMSNAPYLLQKARLGYRLGHQELIDHMLYDGLEDAYEKGKSMGQFAEQFAQQQQYTRATQDEYATRSLQRAQKAIAEKSFADEIAPIQTIDTDEHPLSVKIEKIPQLKPAFATNGTITAANSSSIADGAAALVLMRAEDATKYNSNPVARIIGFSSYAKKPAEFTTAPIDAIKKLLTQINWTVEQVDLFEINEAFAVVALAAIKELHIPTEKLNIHGGGCALGHPIGASGARIIVTLIAALKKYHLKRGIAALCIGGGEATAVAIELIN